MIVIQIAGTNGKGSVANYLSSILIEAGYTTGLFTSPHLVEKEERVQVNGKPIPKSDWDRLAACSGDQGLFLQSFSVCLQWFREKGVEVAVMETGLGGRRDPVTKLHPAINILTSIDLDHMEILGDTVEKICLEKCATIPKGGCVIALPQQASVRKIIAGTCQLAGARLQQMEERDIEIFPESFSCYGMDALQVQALGRLQCVDAAAAVLAGRALFHFGVRCSEEAIRRGLKKAVIPCRIQYLREQGMIIDGGHNSNAFHALKKTLEESFCDQNLVLLAASMKDKDVSALADLAKECCSGIVVTTLAEPRARSAAEMGELFPEAVVEEDLDQAFAKAKKMAAQQRALLLVAGSFYLAGEILSRIGQ